MLGIERAVLASPVAASGTAAKLNFDGSKRQPRQAKPPVAVTGTAAPVKLTTFSNVADIDAEIRRRINEYKAEAPENYFQDGELDEKQAFNVAYNMFRVQIEKGGK